ncbi:hypothetical protein [Arthrobacter nitrophenolicus]|uniref:hypothetical protein n=1 Tax=Arthrobacter nitrophenolicus TaxID=683150 RepID=UPI00197AA7E9|nr:hypothetical protein [Arthrobacter nitrophenolicus]
MTEYALPEAFVHFFDDAAVFPPGRAPLEVALRDYIARRQTALAAAVGPLVLPLKDLPEARQLAADFDFTGGPIEASIVTPAGHLKDAFVAAASARPLINVVSIELKTNPLDQNWAGELLAAASTTEQCQLYVELTAEQIESGALQLIARTGVRLKYRTGGIEQVLFPTPAQVASVLAAAAEQEVPFKLTAGLHRAMRYTDPETGFTHHGFINISVATALARSGASEATLQSVLQQTNPAVLAELFASVSPNWRESFNSFGTCSITEPLQTLEEMGILPPGASALAISLQKAVQS